MREVRPKLVGPPKEEQKGPNGSVVDRSVFATANPANSVEGIISVKLTDEKCVHEAYARIVEFKNTAATNAELRAGINQVLHDIASRNDVEYTPTVVKLLMKHWTEKKNGGPTYYDEHMKDHVEAIKCLFKAWAKDRYNWNKKLRVLDASCGTGTVLKALLDSLPTWMISRIRVTANDISEDAIAAARKTLRRYEKRITYERHDITRKLPSGKYDLVILSQTIPFITDDNAVKKKRLGKTTDQDEDNHVEAKKQLIIRLLRKLKNEDSEFLLLDEQPMKLSPSGDDFSEIIEEMLFNEVFRKIEKDTLVNEVMKNIREKRFIGQLETPIDREHHMYLMAYSRVKKGGHNKKPFSEERPSMYPIETVNGLRNLDQDEMDIVRHMENTYPYLADRLKGFRSEAFRPVTGTRLVIDRKKYDEEIKGNSNFWKKNGTNDLVIISGLVHELGEDGYLGLIKSLKQSGKVKPGSLLLFIDPYYTREELLQNKELMDSMPNLIGNSDARLKIFKSTEHGFLTSYRSGNKYGYLYLVKDTTSLPLQPSED